jgi:transposase InsO family protein
LEYPLRNWQGGIGGDRGRGVKVSRAQGVRRYYDNAVMESFCHTLKVELSYGQRYRTRGEAQTAVFDYIEIFYNRQRLHSSLDCQTPEAFERAA